MKIKQYYLSFIALSSILGFISYSVIYLYCFYNIDTQGIIGKYRDIAITFVSCGIISLFIFASSLLILFILRIKIIKINKILFWVVLFMYLMVIILEKSQGLDLFFD